ncbi:hypothetical protein E9531_10920 [Lampropedia puyangensis]|uniref:Uncharacterized protein n=1 Tax=Lampropedia puyangensis TaxID=1330072 RepID=A0A4S8EZA2_9BURK|nr:hypothetical protein [Lampropedia puyangensis]THU00270.1 hypothetical protein E9531_10920 [Lampropedia puyangensis]
MSKLILTVVVVAVAIGLWRLTRQSARQAQQRKAAKPLRIRQMVRCTVCGAQVDDQFTVMGPKGPQCKEHGLSKGSARHKAKP